MKYIICILCLSIHSFCFSQINFPKKVIEKGKVIYSSNSGDSGKLLAVNKGSGINIYKTDTFSLSYSIEIPAKSIDFSDISDLLVCGDFQGKVHCFRGKLLTEKFKAHELKITKVKLNNLNTLIATTSIDSTIKIWSLDKSELISKLKYQSGLITDFKFSLDNNLLIFSTSKGEVIVWDYTNDALISTFKSHKGIARSIAISTDNTTFASCGDDGRIIIYPNNHEYYELAKAHENKWVMDIEFLNKDYLVSIGHDQKLVMSNINLSTGDNKNANYFYPIKMYKLSGDKYLNDIEILNNLNYIAISTLGNGIKLENYFKNYSKHDVLFNIGGHMISIKDLPEFRVTYTNLYRIQGTMTRLKTLKHAWIVDSDNNKTNIKLDERGSFYIDVRLPKIENKFSIIIEDMDISLLPLKYEIKIYK